MRSTTSARCEENKRRFCRREPSKALIAPVISAVTQRHKTVERTVAHAGDMCRRQKMRQERGEEKGYVWVISAKSTSQSIPDIVHCQTRTLRYLSSQHLAKQWERKYVQRKWCVEIRIAFQRKCIAVCAIKRVVARLETPCHARKERCLCSIGP